MISRKSLTKEWLEKTKKLYKGKDPILIEKVIRAFTLLEQLKLKGLDFIFRGGSSLLLLINCLRTQYNRNTLWKREKPGDNQAVV